MSVTAGLNALLPASDTFSDWLTTTNNLSEYLRDHVMTASANTAEQDTNGDARLIGDFAANTIIATDALRGGTLVASANLVISSNTVAQANVRITGAASELFIESGRITTGNTLQESITYTSTSASDVVDRWPKSESSGFKYLLNAEDAAGDNYIIEFLAVHDTTTVVFTRYAELLTGSITVDVTPVINGANVEINVVSGASGGNQYVYKIFRTALI